MKTLLVLTLSLFLTACQLMPVKPKWPDVPEILKEPCPELNTVETDKLSVLLDTVIDNYALYHECSAKQEAWSYWYDEQKRIYDDIK
jgi:hypothetical protein